MSDQRRNLASKTEQAPPTGVEPSPRFLADAMLGRLAKWLRLLGYDTLYANDLDDARIVRQARAQGRLILTRDTGLARRKGVPALLIESEDTLEQAAQVVSRFPPPPQGLFSRCPVCNELLLEVAKEEIQRQVPPYVYATQERFRQCPHCGRLFWRGTHWQRIRERLARIGF